MIKKFNGAEVVIMTTKQAEGINTKFLQMKDSIADLTNTFNGCLTSLYFTQDKLDIALDSLSRVVQNYNISMSNYNNRTREYNELKKEYSELRKDYIRANRNHRDNTAGLLIATGLFTGILLILSGK